MTGGFIVVHRTVFESKWYVEAPPLVRCLWFYLMGRANFADGKTARGEILRPGMLVTSWRSLAQALAWKEKRGKVVPTIKQIRGALACLRRAGEASWTVAKISGAGVGAGRGAGVRKRSGAGVGIVVTLERWAFHQGASGSGAGVRKRSGAGSGAGVGATLKQEDHENKKKPEEPIPGINTNTMRRGGDLSSMSREQQEEYVRFLREEIPKRRAELAKERSNGNDPGKVLELNQEIRRSRKMLRELEGLRRNGEGDRTAGRKSSCAP